MFSVHFVFLKILEWTLRITHNFAKVELIQDASDVKSSRNRFTQSGITID